MKLALQRLCTKPNAESDLLLMKADERKVSTNAMQAQGLLPHVAALKWQGLLKMSMQCAVRYRTFTSLAVFPANIQAQPVPELQLPKTQFRKSARSSIRGVV